MSAPYPIDEPSHTLQTRVQETYERVACNPYGRYHFHRGPSSRPGEEDRP
jgi:hypothetical protein